MKSEDQNQKTWQDQHQEYQLSPRVYLLLALYAHLVIPKNLIVHILEQKAVEDHIISVFVVDKKLNKIDESTKDYMIKKHSQV